MAQRLWEHLAEIGQRLIAAKSAWLGLDFDGTLVPIVSRPELVVLPAATKKLLERLAALPRLKVAIISGRSLANVRELVGLDTIAYSGNHGIEIELSGHHLEFRLPSGMHRQLCTVACQLSISLGDLPGVLIENKIHSLSIHYRLAPAETWDVIRRTVESSVLQQSELRVHHGAMVWEVRPAINKSKGTAAVALREKQAGQDSVPIFIGDDLTDEDAFIAFPDGITVHVGQRHETAANYQVASSPDVIMFLASLENWLTTKQGEEVS